jgi:hypothetical protein
MVHRSIKPRPLRMGSKQAIRALTSDHGILKAAFPGDLQLLEFRPASKEVDGNPLRTVEASPDTRILIARAPQRAPSVGFVSCSISRRLVASQRPAPMTCTTPPSES